MTHGKAVLLGTLSLVALLGAIGFWLNAGDEQAAPRFEQQTASVDPSRKPAPSRQVQAADDAPGQRAPDAILPDNRQSAVAPGFTTETQGQMQDIARAYKESSRFPSYSPPLESDDWELLNPRAFVPRETPLAGHPDISATIEVDRYVVEVSKPLQVRVLVASPSPAVSAVTISLLGPQGPGGPVALAGQPAGAGVQIFSGEIPASLLAAMGEGEVGLVASLAIMGDDPVSVTAQLKLYVPEARLLYLGDPYVEGANLVIPAHFEVRTTGFYRVRANLFQQEGERPVAHLNAAFMLDAQAPTGLLRVHAETLRAMQAPGPYLLTDIDITRSPARPGDTTGYGSSAEPSYAVSGFSLGSYSNEPYVDEAVQQRQEFLDRLSEGGETP